MITKRISKKKFIFSAEYREGVNDAIDELLSTQKGLLDEHISQENCDKIYDEVVNSFYDTLEEDSKDDDIRNAAWHAIWDIIYRIIYRAYKRSLEKISVMKIIQRELNQELVDKNTRNNVELRTRYKILKRDCFKCVSCGDSPSTDPKVTLVVDHIQPITKGGKNILSNYQTLCHFCNTGKSNFY